MKDDIIIQKGDTAKYEVAITHDDFDQQTDPFFVVLHTNIPEQTITIDREDMLHDEDGHFYMRVPSGNMAGLVKAICHYTVTDSDIEGGTREEVDIQYIGFVTDSPCVHLDKHIPFGAPENNHVLYTRIYRNDAHTLYLNVRTVDKQPVVDAEGKQIRVRKEEKDIY